MTQRGPKRSGGLLVGWLLVAVSCGGAGEARGGGEVVQDLTPAPDRGIETATEHPVEVPATDGPEAARDGTADLRADAEAEAPVEGGDEVAPLEDTADAADAGPPGDPPAEAASEDATKAEETPKEADPGPYSPEDPGPAEPDEYAAEEVTVDVSTEPSAGEELSDLAPFEDGAGVSDEACDTCDGASEGPETNDIASDASGSKGLHLLVVDRTLASEKGRVVEIRDDTEAWQFPPPGDADPAKRLSHPSGACRMKDGRTAIADTGHHRILVVDAAGNVTWSSEDFSLALNLKSPRDVNETLPGRLVVVESISNPGTVANYSKGRILEIDTSKTDPADVVTLVISADDQGIEMMAPQKAEYVDEGAGYFLFTSVVNNRIFLVSRDKQDIRVYSDSMNGFYSAYRLPDKSVLAIIGVAKRVAEDDLAMSAPILNTEDYPALNFELIVNNVLYCQYLSEMDTYLFSYNSSPGRIVAVRFHAPPEYEVTWSSEASGSVTLSYPKDVDVLP